MESLYLGFSINVYILKLFYGSTTGAIRTIAVNLYFVAVHSFEFLVFIFPDNGVVHIISRQLAFLLAILYTQEMRVWVCCPLFYH